ncbi:hypothetical protein CA85_34140 [Allorhodopirellula solitaria]|uniref:Uncharacterized protein n=1 Tax=Allorhodopirellula solitaria TaxID=2527987 RepID=A0A5C5XR06_9BACT|nr:hypothetical protein CA85_34140 [Allorhodopirellula solitaria]
MPAFRMFKDRQQYQLAIDAYGCQFEAMAVLVVTSAQNL